MLQNGAQVDAQEGVNHWTPLHYVCHNYSCRTSTEQLQVATTLLDWGADLEHVNRNGDTPLAVALRGRLTLLAWLLIRRGANVHATTRFGHTSLLLSIRPKFRPCIQTRPPDQELVLYLLQHDVDANRATRGSVTPLKAAIDGQHLDIATLLLEHGASVDVLDRNQHTPLQCVMNDNHPPAFQLEAIRLLLRHGADAHAASRGGPTPLEQAKLSPAAWAIMHHHLTVKGQLCWLGGLHPTMGENSSLFTDFASSPLFDRNLIPLIWEWYNETHEQVEHTHPSAHTTVLSQLVGPLGPVQPM
jgi:ankyrin